MPCASNKEFLISPRNINKRCDFSLHRLLVCYQIRNLDVQFFSIFNSNEIYFTVSHRSDVDFVSSPHKFNRNDIFVHITKIWSFCS